MQSSPPTSNPQPAPEKTLADLRAELDGIDAALHDTLMRRADVVAEVGRLGAKGRVALRPGREAAIIRRLLARHQGGLPRVALARIWRELLSATTAMQGAHAVAVCEIDASSQFVQVAREHFGALTPLRVHRSPALAINEVSQGRVTAAVLPLPAEDELPAAAWWIALLHRDDPRIHVVAKLPFWGARPEGAPRVAALVVTTIPPDPSGHDRSLIGLELPLEMSRARLSGVLVAAGFAPRDTLLRRDPRAQVAQALIEVEGLVRDDDPRLSRLTEALRPPVVVGAYAIPLEGDGV